MRSSFWGSLTVLACVIFATPASAANLVADYRFDDNYQSSVGSGPPLSPIGSGTFGFSTEIVDGVPDRVLTFTEGAGLGLGTDGLVPSSSYSFVLTFKFAQTDNAYDRVFDALRGTSDYGLYVSSNSDVGSRTLTWWKDIDNYGTAPFVANTYGTVAITRAASHQLDVYLNGVPQITYNDAGASGVLAFNQANVFLDNGDDDEEAAGAIARLRVWNGPLSAAEVAALDKPTQPPPATLPATLPAALAARSATTSIAGKVKVTVGKKGGVTVDTGILAVCPAGGATCTGSVTISTRSKLAKSRRIGRSRIQLAAGKSKRVTTRLTKKGARALRKRKLAARIVVRLAGPDGKTARSNRRATLKYPKRR